MKNKKVNSQLSIINYQLTKAKLRQENEDALNKPRHSVKRRMNMLICVRFFRIFVYQNYTRQWHEEGIRN